MNINFTPLIILALIGLVFGIWKIIEIVIFLSHHIKLI